MILVVWKEKNGRRTERKEGQEADAEMELEDVAPRSCNSNPLCSSCKFQDSIPAIDPFYILHRLGNARTSRLSI